MISKYKADSFELPIKSDEALETLLLREYSCKSALREGVPMSELPSLTRSSKV